MALSIQRPVGMRYELECGETETIRRLVDMPLFMHPHIFPSIHYSLLPYCKAYVVVFATMSLIFRLPSFLLPSVILPLLAATPYAAYTLPWY